MHILPTIEIEGQRAHIFKFKIESNQLLSTLKYALEVSKEVLNCQILFENKDFSLKSPIITSREIKNEFYKAAQKISQDKKLTITIINTCPYNSAFDDLRYWADKLNKEIILSL